MKRKNAAVHCEPPHFRGIIGDVTRILLQRLKQSLADFTNGKIEPGPDLEGLRALIEQHGKSVFGTTAARGCHPKKAGLAGIVDCVKDIETGTEK